MSTEPQREARTMSPDEINQLCLTVQQCLLAARISIDDGIELHTRMLVSVLLSKHDMDREKAAKEVENLLTSITEHLRSASYEPQQRAKGGILLQ